MLYLWSGFFHLETKLYTLIGKSFLNSFPHWTSTVLWIWHEDVTCYYRRYRMIYSTIFQRGGVCVERNPFITKGLEICFQSCFLGTLHLGLPQRGPAWGAGGGSVFRPSPCFSVKSSPAFVSLRAAESLPGFKSWLKNLLLPPRRTMDSLWSGEGYCTGRHEVETKRALRSAVISRVHLEINPLPSWEGEI